MAVTVGFAAEVLADNGRKRPKRIRDLDDSVIPVRNPFSGHVLWVWEDELINVVNGVAHVRLVATYSGRRRKLSATNVELINWLTGNTFLVSPRAISGALTFQETS